MVTLNQLKFFRLGERKQGIRLRRAGDKAMLNRDWARAISSYEQYLRQQPTDVAILVQFGHALKESGRTQDALSAYDRAVSAAPGNEDAALHRRLLKDATGRVPPGLRPTLSVETGGGDFIKPRSLPVSAPSQLRADQARDLGDWREAAALYSEHLRGKLDDGAIWLQLGHMLKTGLFLEDAVFAYQVARRLDQGSSDVRVHLADLLMRLGRTSDAQPLWADMFIESGAFFLQGK